jgi:probable F420-dependent oxidoreductase
MKWGIVGLGGSAGLARPEMLLALAESAEAAGFESIWAGDHVVFPASYDSPYPFSTTGVFKRMGSRHGESTFEADNPFPEPLLTFAFLASRTKTLRFGTGVIILPQRNPLVLAKEAATLDFLSGGRLMLGVGVGWLREECEAIGTPWERRGARTDEYIAVMRALWQHRETSFDGEFVSFAAVRCDPHPVQPGWTIPIHVGGHNPVAARRAGRIGDGFFPAIFPNSEVPKLLPLLIGEMWHAARAAGRDPAAVEVTSGGARNADAAAWFRDIGVHRLVIQPHATNPADIREELMDFGAGVIAKTAAW